MPKVQNFKLSFKVVRVMELQHDMKIVMSLIIHDSQVMLDSLKSKFIILKKYCWGAIFFARLVEGDWLEKGPIGGQAKLKVNEYNWSMINWDTSIDGLSLVDWSTKEAGWRTNKGFWRIVDRDPTSTSKLECGQSTNSGLTHSR